jgi:hypothetical protein
MPELTKLIVDCSTGEETIRPFTAVEITEFEAAAVSIAEREAAEKAAAEKAAADKASGNQKLKDLGLTDDEIAALTS